MDAPSPAPVGRLRFWLTEAVLLLGVLGLALKLSYDHASSRDLELVDEPYYLWWGLLLPTHGLQPAEMSPLYSVWYYLLSLVQPDVTRLTFLNWSVLAGLLSVSLYILTRCLGAARLTALLVPFLVLATGIIEIRPYLMHLAISLLALGGALAAACRSWRWRWAILSVTFMLVGYIRPEMYVAFLLCVSAGLGITIWKPIRGLGPRRRFVLPLLVVAACTGLLGWRVGIPLGSRSFVAFSQHYVYNRALEQHHPSPVAAVVRYETLVQTDFGDATTIGKALQINPGAFGWHMLRNLDSARFALRTILEPQLRLPPAAKLAFQVAVAAALSVGALGLLWQLRHRLASPEAGALATGLLLLTLVVMPTGAASLIIYPREHYLMPSLCFGLVVLVASLSLLPACRKHLHSLDRLPVLAGVLVVLYVLLPNRTHGWDVGTLLRAAPQREQVPFPHRPIVAALRRLPVQGPVNFLDYFSFSRLILAGKTPQFTPVYSKDAEPFWSFVRRTGITVIVLDSFLCADPEYAHDPEFQELVLGRAKPADFVRLNVPHSPAQLVVRRDLLPAAAAALPAEPEGPDLRQFRAELAAKFRQLNQQSPVIR